MSKKREKFKRASLVVPNNKRRTMMRKSIAGRVLSVLSTLAMSIAPVAIAVAIHTSVARAQDKPSVTQAKVDLTTDPSPAQKGSNTVRIKLTDPAGKPIIGAQVTATFFMAAMPAMNMAEMKTVMKGTYKGGGVYEAKGDLGSGGMWEVTVTAQKGGKTIVTQKLTVKAMGGA
jgi:Cu(I)/Ag(I) efflux system membrane fusion protein/cobalt-zinc-cadmium efflux system membrane fusion protein